MLLLFVDYNAVAAWSGLAAAVAALLGVGVIVFTMMAENRRARFLLSADLIFRLSEGFDGADIRRARRAAVESVKENGPGDFDDVLDFFELVGMLTRRRALDEEMVWATFYYWINNYWHISQNHISTVRRDNGDNTVW